MEKKEHKKINKKQIDDDILNIVKGFIDYFEHTNDTNHQKKEESHGNSF